MMMRKHFIFTSQAGKRSPALVGYLCCSPVPKHGRDLLASRLTFGYNMIQIV